MLTAPRITIEEMHDEDDLAMNDFTPADRRVFARSLKVEVGRKPRGIAPL